MKKKAVIFDLDGTLLDTLEDLKNAVNEALVHFHYDPKSPEQIRSYVGNGVLRLMELSVPGGQDNPEFADIFAHFKAYYKVHSNDNTKPYPGVLAMLGRLTEEGIVSAIVSNKLDGAVKDLNRLYFDRYISVAIGDQEGVARKPAPDTVYKALDELGVDLADAVYVGDSEVDVLTAKHAGMDLICVDWGFRARQELLDAGAEVIVSDTDALIEVLLNR